MSEINSEELSIALSKLPDDIKWVSTNLQHDHKKKLECLDVAIPELGVRAIEKRKKEFYAGRWCAAQAIHSKVGSYLSPQIHQDRSPSWPVGLVGSISHTDNHAIAMVAGEGEYLGLGIDIQEFIAPDEKPDIRPLILSPSESELSELIPYGKGFEVFFSAKESLYKALYPRCLDLFEHKDVEILNLDSLNKTLVIRLIRSLKKQWVKDQIFYVSYSIASRYALTWVAITANQ